MTILNTYFDDQLLRRYLPWPPMFYAVVVQHGKLLGPRVPMQPDSTVVTAPLLGIVDALKAGYEPYNTQESCIVELWDAPEGGQRFLCWVLAPGELLGQPIRFDVCNLHGTPLLLLHQQQQEWRERESLLHPADAGDALFWEMFRTRDPNAPPSWAERSLDD
jgi:hypothetical protein